MTAPAPSRPPGRVSSRNDPALSLLSQVLSDSLDPGYADEARRRTGSDDNGRRDRRDGRWVLGVVLALVALGCVALVLQVRESAPDVAEARVQLAARVDERADRNAELEASIADLQADVDDLRSRILEATGEGDVLGQQLEALQLATGTTAVVGPGMVVTLDDADPDDVPPDTDPSLARILDSDIQLAVNGLWAAGAEAVSVNGQRLTSLSAIRSAGDAVLVNYRPLTRPYVIEAIGDAQAMEVQFVDGEAGRTLRTLQQTYGIGFDTDVDDELQLSGAPVGELDQADATTGGGAG